MTCWCTVHTWCTHCGIWQIEMSCYWQTFQTDNTPKQNEHCLRNFDLSDYRQILVDLGVWIYHGMVQLIEARLQPMIGMQHLIVELSFSTGGFVSTNWALRLAVFDQTVMNSNAVNQIITTQLLPFCFVAFLTRGPKTTFVFCLLILPQFEKDS